jgi:hypothetical protein
MSHITRREEYLLMEPIEPIECVMGGPCSLLQIHELPSENIHKPPTAATVLPTFLRALIFTSLLMEDSKAVNIEA